MSKDFVVYIDLDETLIHSQSYWKSNTKDFQWAVAQNVSTSEYSYFSQSDFKKAKFSKQKSIERDFYSIKWKRLGQEYYVHKFRTRIRPEAKEFLAALRKEGYETVMLTKANFVYAQIMNDIFELGFDKIVAREHWFRNAAFLPDKKNVLIDNLEQSKNEKMGWLGRTNLLYIKVPDFYGYKNEKKINTDAILLTIKLLKT